MGQLSLPSDRSAQRVDRRLFGDPSPELLELVEKAVVDRPEPLRQYDQIHMDLLDVARHLSFVAALSEGRRIVFMGDSDGVALCLAIGSAAGLLPEPSAIALLDFDQRVLQFVKSRCADEGVSDDLVLTQTYNVFDPVPRSLQNQFDLFHTNPPYGRYNRGQSVMAFVERAISCCVPGAEGLIVLGNDERYDWTQLVLRSVLGSLVRREVVPFRVLHRLHAYDLDDEPGLESGLIHCRDVQPMQGESPNSPLPSFYREKFYGRKTIRIPQHIALNGNAIQTQMEFPPS